MNLCMILFSFLCIFISIIKIEVRGVINNVKALKEDRNKIMYRKPHRRIIKQWALEHDEPLKYQRDDKQRLDQVHQVCPNYNECMSKLAHNLTESGHLSNTILRVYAGSVAKIQCDLYVSAAEKNRLIWMYAKTITNLSLSPMEEKETAICETENLTIYNTKVEDAGVYQCIMDDRHSGLTVLEVTEDEKYHVVKPRSSHGPYQTPTEAIGQYMIIFTSWSRWSECSRCGLVGRRRRYGICFAGLRHFNDVEAKKVNETSHSNFTHNLLKEETIKLFHEFPRGIPCRSTILPRTVIELHAIQSRRNEIMLGLCKVPCQDEIFQYRSNTGELLDRVNNSEGVYSPFQNIPPSPPPVARDILFVTPGEKTDIRCPGTILRDIPVTWRIGTKQIEPRLLDRSSGGRMHLNARDRIVIAAALHDDANVYRTDDRQTDTEWELDRSSSGRTHLNARDRIVIAAALYDDANVYSCWQDEILAGVVKLEVLKSAEATYNQRFLLIVIVFATAIILRLVVRFMRDYQRIKTNIII